MMQENILETAAASTAVAESDDTPRFIAIYHHSQTALRYLYYLMEECLIGFWLGILSNEAIGKIGEHHYADDSMYVTDEYNEGGLYPWEQYVIDRYFKDCGRLLVLGAGGGREIYGLRHLPVEISAYECSPKFVSYGRSFLARHSLNATLDLIQPDECPATTDLFDGAIVGWGSYMLIQGRKRRIELLTRIRGQLRPGAPILISFFSFAVSKKRFILSTRIANVLRIVRSRERIEVGDFLVPNYVHFFKKREIASEFIEAGFRPEFYATEPYGHAVAFHDGSGQRDLH